MKKFTKILGAAALLLCGLMITGCEDIKDEFEGPKNMWLTKEVTYQKDGTGVGAKATVYLYYTDDENPTVQGLSSDVELKTGLNIVFIPDEPEGDTVSTLYNTFKNAVNDGDIPFAVFNLPKGKESTVNDDGSSEAFKITMSDAKWTAFCLANPKTKNTATTEIPYPLKSGYFGKVDVTTEEIKALFSWRQLLIMLLQQ